MLNKVMIIGNVGNIETRTTNTGDVVCNFSVAVNEKYNDKETTEWFRCIAWNKTAQLIEDYLRKGSKVFIEGKQRTNSWEDKDGNKRESKEVFVQNIKFLSSKNSTDNNPPDDVPF